MGKRGEEKERRGRERRGGGREGATRTEEKGGRRVFLDFLAAFAAGGVGEPLGNTIYCQ